MENAVLDALPLKSGGKKQKQNAFYLTDFTFVRKYWTMQIEGKIKYWAG